MMKQIIIQVICVAVLSGIQVTYALTCYHCTDKPGGDDYRPYDADCGRYDYHGASTEQDSDATCYIALMDDGFIQRSIYADNYYDDGDCRFGAYYTECFCKGELCNTNSFCAQCGYPRPTPITTEQTTSTTDPTTLTPATREPTTSNPTTTEPVATLRCYTCVDCPKVEDSTPVIEGDFLTCVSTIFLNSAEVIRSGSHEDQPDECIHHAETLSCYCSSDLCNDYTLEF
ncbi:unnamed protein product [Meganyctiphanes norvegica]|uniref:Uncharacterized protein n=1 Tax=Meganyctiphanes norvegica TaxID=48144 RepID=A0AAV2PX66_MEGNR